MVTGGDGRELWRAEFPHDLLESGMRARAGVQDAMSLVDLDGDGHNEVLVNARFLPNWAHSDLLVCFTGTGKELWRFSPGREVSTRTETFPPPYNIWIVRQTPVMHDRSRYLVVSSFNELFYPNQVAILDAGGRMVREYWHSGRFTALTLADLDHDGEPELYLAGISNSYRRGTLVGLRLQDVSGASQEVNQDYQLLDFAPAHEMLRVLFSRSDLNVAENPFNAVNEVFESAGSLAVHLTEHFPPGKAVVHFRLNQKFEVTDISAGDYFPMEHDELFRLGKLDHKFERHRDIDPLRTLTYLHRP